MTIIYSEDQGLINHKINSLVKNNLDNYEVFMYKTPNQLIDLLHAKSLFLEKEKHFIIHGCSFLSDENECKIAFDLFRVLEMNQNLDVFLTINSPKLLSNANIKKIKELFEVIEIPKLNSRSFHNLAISLLKEKKINLSFDQINNLLSKIPQDAQILNNEIDKLRYFTKDEISDELIENLIFEYSNVSIFKMVEYILTEKIDSAIKLLDALVPQFFSYIELLQIMASQVLKLIMISWSLNKKIDDATISKSLDISSYQFREMKKICRIKGIKELDFFLNSILTLDIKLKMFSIDPNSIRLFIVKGNY
ncbi:DNA polymerase III subunit delta [Mycoplasmoides alvi]|uniref:DNA polymerase III subunit delta n=1 Tax=Mycoplasmoides alvi TaxID=78580 RepID=UPI00051ADE74|nr:hypothetical protein [Mycoplasmoides alvi]